MSTTTTSSSTLGRILALLIAIALVLIGWLIWQNVERQQTSMAGVDSAQQLETLQITPAIQACIDKRTNYFNGLVEDGIYTRERADEDIISARNLCIQRESTPRETQF